MEASFPSLYSNKEENQDVDIENALDVERDRLWYALKYEKSQVDFIANLFKSCFPNKTTDLPTLHQMRVGTNDIVRIAKQQNSAIPDRRNICYAFCKEQSIDIAQFTRLLALMDVHTTGTPHSLPGMMRLSFIFNYYATTAGTMNESGYNALLGDMEKYGFMWGYHARAPDSLEQCRKYTECCNTDIPRILVLRKQSFFFLVAKGVLDVGSLFRINLFCTSNNECWSEIQNVDHNINQRSFLPGFNDGKAENNVILNREISISKEECITKNIKHVGGHLTESDYNNSKETTAIESELCEVMNSNWVSGSYTRCSTVHDHAANDVGYHIKKTTTKKENQIVGGTVQSRIYREEVLSAGTPRGACSISRPCNDAIGSIVRHSQIKRTSSTTSSEARFSVISVNYGNLNQKENSDVDLLKAAMDSYRAEFKERPYFSQTQVMCLYRVVCHFEANLIAPKEFIEYSRSIRKMMEEMGREAHLELLNESFETSICLNKSSRIKSIDSTYLWYLVNQFIEERVCNDKCEKRKACTNWIYSLHQFVDDNIKLLQDLDITPVDPFITTHAFALFDYTIDEFCHQFNPSESSDELLKNSQSKLKAALHVSPKTLNITAIDKKQTAGNQFRVKAYVEFHSLQDVAEAYERSSVVLFCIDTLVQQLIGRYDLAPNFQSDSVARTSHSEPQPERPSTPVLPTMNELPNERPPKKCMLVSSVTCLSAQPFTARSVGDPSTGK